MTAPKSRQFAWLAVLAIMLCALAAGESACEDATVTERGFSRPAPGQAAGPNAPQAVSPNVGTGDLYALVVGVSKYKLPTLKLNLADNDAKEFARFLETQKRVFKDTQVRLLLNEEATREAIETHLHYELIKAGKDDTVIIFLSGHGSDDPKKPNDYFFLGHDADPARLAATSVKMNGLEFLKGINSKRVLLIADACHSEGFSQVRTRSTDKSLDQFMRQFKGSAGRAILTSSRAGELSQERTNLPNGVFTYFLLRGLRGEADSNRTGVVHLTELYQFVYDRTKDLTEGAQHPHLESSVEGAFPVSWAEDPKDSIRLEVSFIAQDPRCVNPKCTDPTPDVTSCHDPQCGDVPLRNGDTMYSRQNYQIAVRPSETCYLYVYNVCKQSGIFRLFPGKEFLPPENPLENPLKGGAIYWFPGKNRWLKQDEAIGDEKIYVVAGRSRNTMLEDLYAHLEQLRKQGGSSEAAKEAQEKMGNYLDKTMGATNVLPMKVPNTAAGRADHKIRTFEEAARIFEAPGLDAVESVSFTHKAR